MTPMLKRLLVIAAIFVVALLVLNMGEYAPYAAHSVFASTPAEGFDGASANVGDLREAADAAEKKVKDLVHPAQTVSEMPQSSTLQTESFAAMDSDLWSAASATRSRTYGVLSDVAAAAPIDKFSQVTTFNAVDDGKNGCHSAGLTTDRGMMCLPPELLSLLQTRGGNATGGDLHIEHVPADSSAWSSSSYQ
jgi:hypothetical protein